MIWAKHLHIIIKMIFQVIIKCYWWDTAVPDSGTNSKAFKTVQANGFQKLIFVPCDHKCPECLVLWGYYKLYIIIKRPHAIGAMNNLLLSFICIVIKWNKLGAK